MKKLLILFSIFTLLFISCEEEKESHEIEGTWQITSRTRTIDGEEIYTNNYVGESCEANDTMTFYGNTNEVKFKTFWAPDEVDDYYETQEYEYSNCIFETETLSYGINGNELSLDGITYEFRISGDTLTIIYSYEQYNEIRTTISTLSLIHI